MNVCCCCGYVSQSSVPRIFISNPMGQITMKVCQDVRSLALARQNEPATSRGNRGKFSSLQKYQAKQNNDSPLREERLDSPKTKKAQPSTSRPVTGLGAWLQRETARLHSNGQLLEYLRTPSGACHPNWSQPYI